MPEFDGALVRSADIDMLVNLNKAAGSQIRGVGIFASISGTAPNRNSLPSNNQVDGYIAVIQDVDKVYVFNGNPATDWTTAGNWTELGGSFNEVNDLNSSVIWTNVPPANIIAACVTQHEAALSISQGQVSGLTGTGGTLDNLQSQITGNGSDITANATAISTNEADITSLQSADTALQNNINSVNATISGLDTDDITEGSNLYYTTGRFDSAFNGKDTDGLIQGSTNLYNVQANWSSTSGPSQILNKPQVLTDVPANAVFTDTTYSVQDGELSEKNLTSALKTQYDNYAGAISANTNNISNIQNDVTTNEDDIDDLEVELTATQLGAGLNTDGTYTANGAANYTSAAGSLTAADDALDTQVKTNADAIADNTTHRSITSANPHGTSLGQVSDVSTSGGATNDVLAQNSSGSFDLKNPFDLFMAAAETLGDFPTSGATLGDINGDGTVGTADLLIFLGNYQDSIFDISSQSITFTSMSSTPVSIEVSSLNESNYNTQATLSNLTKLNIGAQTSDNSISPYDWIVNQTNDYIQFYTTDGSDISGSSGFEYFDNAKVQIANPTNLQVSVEATPDDTIFALYCYIETIYPSSTQSQLKLVGTYSVNDFDQTINVNQDAANPIVIDHLLFAVNSGDYPTAARIYFYVGIPESPEYGTFTCSISDLKLKIIQ